MQNTVIRVKALKKSYKNVDVLTGVDFDVESGSIFALLGSNGAGKTTIVKILTTLLAPDSGSAQVGGFDCINITRSGNYIIWYGYIYLFKKRFTSIRIC